MSSDKILGDRLTSFRLDVESIKNTCVLRQVLSLLLNDMWEYEYERDEGKQKELNEKASIVQRRIAEIERERSNDRS